MLLWWVAAFEIETFEAIKVLDEKCVFLENYSSKIETKSFIVIIVSILSITLDVIGMWKLELSPSTVTILTLAFAIHDTEIGFYSVIISGINLRLFSIVETNAKYGSKIYRHILLIAAHIEKEYNLPKGNITMFLVWREFKSFYSLWLLCSAASKTNSACDQLIHQLSNVLALKFESQEKTAIQKITESLYHSVKFERPRYVNASVLSIDLGVPLTILDISINYLLIILQIYIAYIMKQ
ncbi:unnamed protein product [Parnassius apollo]|uniref:(apollo) hypothetical protein n=1 Tax=Parnassius apollo TaxID=110799 RepID=A0A8S3VYA7_PARAO|nr:unnamed protein product [Parnassius apollo]